jgi:hypothetical protein
MSLFVAFALPVLLEQALMEGIAEQVVMTPNNPNLAAWTTNIGSNGDADSSRRRRRLQGEGGDSLYGSDDVSTDGGELHYDTYFFNVTNPDEVIKGAKPSVDPIGPYAHDEYFEKFDITWDDKQDEVTYNTWKYYLFNHDNSAAGLTVDDELTLIYPTVIGFQFLMDQLPTSSQEMLKEAIQNELTTQYTAVENGLQRLEDYINNNITLPTRTKEKYIGQIDTLNAAFTTLFDDIDDWVASIDNPTDLLLKIVLAKSPWGISPFFKVKPEPGYFGWLNDPVLLEVQAILDLVEAKTNTTIPWTSAVPGSVANYTSIADARRRLGRTTMKTGKSKLGDAGQVVYYEGMEYIHGCTNAMASQNTSAYVEGEEFPACEIFDLSWNDSVAEAKGYSLAWATDEANFISGGSGEIFGPGVNDDLTQVFIGDIYRSALLEHSSDVNWYGVDLYRLTIRHQDMLNNTVYPPNGDYYSEGPMGLLNMTSASGAPAFGSYPHFLLSDPRLLNAIDGLDPNLAEHMTFLDVEPNTGLLATARKQLQTNYFLANQSFPASPKNFKDDAHLLCANISAILTELGKAPIECGQADGIFDIFAQEAGWKLNPETLLNDGNTQGVFMPYAYSSEYMTLPEDDAVSIKNSVYTVQSAEVASFNWGVGCAAFFFACIVAITISRMYKGETLKQIFLGRRAALDDDSNDHSEHDFRTPLISLDEEA